MSNQFSEEYYERLKEAFADENIDLEIDSIQFEEKFKEHMQDLEYWSYNGHPSLTAHERNI
jgi:small-conductance mechanosensitive channel|tara:strand:+ start:186 stop:368 length:183 start_codon:yes stop_codon:yes gene_type:complete